MSEEVNTTAKQTRPIMSGDMLFILACKSDGSVYIETNGAITTEMLALKLMDAALDVADQANKNSSEENIGDSHGFIAV